MRVESCSRHGVDVALERAPELVPLDARRVERERRVGIGNTIARRQLRIRAALRPRRLRRGWCFGRGRLLGLELLDMRFQRVDPSLDPIPLEPREPARGAGERLRSESSRATASTRRGC